MNVRCCWFCLAFVLGMGPLSNLKGCGDKFLVTSRATRYQRARAGRESASILIYVNPADTAKAFAGDSLDEALRKAGHRPTVVITAEQFQSALGRGGWDLVIAGIGDARALAVAPRNFGVLPVIVSPSANEWNQTRKQFFVVLRGPAKSPAVLEAIDEVLAARAKSQSAKSQTKMSKSAI